MHIAGVGQEAFYSHLIHGSALPVSPWLLAFLSSLLLGTLSQDFLHVYINYVNHFSFIHWFVALFPNASYRDVNFLYGSCVASSVSYQVVVTELCFK